MRITRRDYERAKSSLPKLQKVQQIVTEWEKAVAGETRDVSRIEVTPDGTDVTYRKENKDAPRIRTA